MIAKCICGDHRLAGAAYQNSRYGYGYRVYNRLGKGGGRCTICGRVVSSEAARDSKQSGSGKK